MSRYADNLLRIRYEHAKACQDEAEREFLAVEQMPWWKRALSGKSIEGARESRTFWRLTTLRRQQMVLASMSPEEGWPWLRAEMDRPTTARERATGD